MEFEWTLVGGLAPLLVAAVVLFSTSGWPKLVSSYSASRRWPTQRSKDCVVQEDDIPTIDGNDLYYDNATWPKYEPRFNLRLSHLYGPVVRVQLQQRNPLLRLLRWINAQVYHYMCPEWHYDDTTVLINSLTQNQAPLKKLLASCASRAPSFAAGKYLSRGRRIVLQPYGADWLRHRRAFSMLLTKDKVKSRWAKALRFEALTMVERIASSSSSSSSAEPSRKFCIVDEISRFTASSVLQIAYALRATTPEDPVLKELETVSQNIGAAFTPGRYWVANFPLIDLVPAFCAPWKKRLNAHHAIENGLFSRLLQSVEDRLSLAAAGSGTGSKIGNDGQGGQSAVIAVEDCAAAALLTSSSKRNRQQDQCDDHEPLPLERQEVAYLAAGLFEAGTETTAMTINTFLLAAACYPEMTRRAQAEIDKVLLKKKQQNSESYLQASSIPSANAVPTFEDLEQMPYLAAIVRETLRLTPTGSSGVGHTPTATTGRPLSCELLDDKRKKGATRQRLNVAPGVTVLANIYGLHHNVDAFPDPWRFYPDRWLQRGSLNGNKNSAEEQKQEYDRPTYTSLDHTYANFSFGFGKRICPGGTLASYSLSMAICLLLWCFEFNLTDAAQRLCEEKLKQYQDECRAWMKLFPAPRGRTQNVFDEDSLWKEDFEDESDRVGKVLIDANITFKLSRLHLDQCLGLEPRLGGCYIAAAREALKEMQSQV